MKTKLKMIMMLLCATGLMFGVSSCSNPLTSGNGSTWRIESGTNLQGLDDMMSLSPSQGVMTFSYGGFKQEVNALYELDEDYITFHKAHYRFPFTEKTPYKYNLSGETLTIGGCKFRLINKY